MVISEWDITYQLKKTSHQKTLLNVCILINNGQYIWQINMQINRITLGGKHFQPFLRSIIAGNPVVYHATILVHSLTFITEIPVQKICFTFTLISGKETSKHLHKLCTGNAIGLDIPARFNKMVQPRL